jgi:hypothetical protein
MKTHALLWMTLFAATTAVSPAWCAAKEKPDRHTFRLQWRDLERATRGYRIALQLPSGVKRQGDPVAFEPDQLVLDVRKTSDKRAYPKGRAIIPRPEVTSLRVNKTRRTWRIRGTAIGGAIGTGMAVPIAALAENLNNSTALAGALAVAVPAGVGYLLGWAADVNVVEIVVEPGP